jgi:hypothetical protein
MLRGWGVWLLSREMAPTTRLRFRLLTSASRWASPVRAQQNCVRTLCDRQISRAFGRKSSGTSIFSGIQKINIFTIIYIFFNLIQTNILWEAVGMPCRSYGSHASLVVPAGRGDHSRAIAAFAKCALDTMLPPPAGWPT